jgi:single-strand selective monofunctional uracil DNA glycosylase
MGKSSIITTSRALARRADRLRFAEPITHVYNPLVYARFPHEEYLARYARPGCAALLLGMNPGPWGMAQTGVPFGAVDLVRDWLGIEAPVAAPPALHPRRPVLGFASKRSEASGRRLWGWARERYGDPDEFARRFFVWNYCPLAFFDREGRNITPDKLRAAERAPLFALCDESLREIVAILGPRLVVGVGAFAEGRARESLEGFTGTVGGILHPSPASPAANRGWAAQAEAQLAALGAPL